jgi:hypothetical protein
LRCNLPVSRGIDGVVACRCYRKHLVVKHGLMRAKQLCNCDSQLDFKVLSL